MVQSFINILEKLKKILFIPRPQKKNIKKLFIKRKMCTSAYVNFQPFFQPVKKKKKKKGGEKKKKKKKNMFFFVMFLAIYLLSMF